jgi:hypothetical protein
MEYQVLDEGFVYKCPPEARPEIAAGPRLALAANGDVVCTYMLQSALGINDFVPVISRSRNGGRTWEQQGPIWPQLAKTESIFCSISRAPAGDLFLYGKRWTIDEPGESFWSDATQGMKPNELMWARSSDGGKSWSAPVAIPMPISGSAEAPGAMCVTRAGRWLACYAPYNTFDPDLKVERNQLVGLGSDDQGRTWNHCAVMRFPEEDSGAAEAWIVELADGRLLSTAMHVNLGAHGDFPNPYALSTDGGNTWSPTLSTGIVGQSTGLAALEDGRALFIYNQRKYGEVGVWMAVVAPTERDFGLQKQAIVWRAETATQGGTSGDHKDWVDYAFGEPSVLVLPDGTVLTALWCVQPSGSGIRYVRLSIS